MAESLDVYYWDSCMFYEYLNDEAADPLRKQYVQELLLDNRNKKNRICTSVFTHLEVLPKKLAPGKEARYWAQFGSVYFYDIELDGNILNLSREIKDYYFKEPIGTAQAKMVSSGDAIQLATAIIHEVTEFHTRDNKKRGGNVPLIGLDEASPAGLICGKHKLKIVNPTASQGEFDLAP